MKTERIAGEGGARAAKQRANVPHAPSGRRQEPHRSARDRCLGAFVQAKLSISEPDDSYEREADQVADEVMRMPEAQAGRAATGAMIRPASELAPYVAGLSGRGEPLAPATRSFFEPRFGVDLGAVRVHTGVNADRSAQSIDALAYTAGEHIVFRSGHYAPHSSAGQHLLAHELTHVLQQQAQPTASRSAAVSIQREVDPAAGAAYALNGAPLSDYENQLLEWKHRAERWYAAYQKWQQSEVARGTYLRQRDPGVPGPVQAAVNSSDLEYLIAHRVAVDREARAENSARAGLRAVDGAGHELGTYAKSGVIELDRGELVQVVSSRPAPHVLYGLMMDQARRDGVPPQALIGDYFRTPEELEAAERIVRDNMRQQTMYRAGGRAPTVTIDYQAQLDRIALERERQRLSEMMVPSFMGGPGAFLGGLAGAAGGGVGHLFGTGATAEGGWYAGAQAGSALDGAFGAVEGMPGAKASMTAVGGQLLAGHDTRPYVAGAPIEPYSAPTAPSSPANIPAPPSYAAAGAANPPEPVAPDRPPAAGSAGGSGSPPVSRPKAITLSRIDPPVAGAPRYAWGKEDFPFSTPAAELKQMNMEFPGGLSGDMALGHSEGTYLDFPSATNSWAYTTWGWLEGFSPSVPDKGGITKNITTKQIPGVMLDHVSRGGLIHFNLDAMDNLRTLQARFAETGGVPTPGKLNFTEMELGHVLSNPRLYAHTIFYKGGFNLSDKAIMDLGLRPPSTNALQLTELPLTTGLTHGTENPLPRR